MPIFVACYECSKKYKLPDDGRRRLIVCKECGAEIDLEMDRVDVSSSRPRPQRQREEDYDRDYAPQKSNLPIILGVCGVGVLGIIVAIVAAVMLNSDDENAGADQVIADAPAPHQNQPVAAAPGPPAAGVGGQPAADPAPNAVPPAANGVGGFQQEHAGAILKIGAAQRNENFKEQLVKVSQTQELDWGPRSIAFSPHHNLVAIGKNDRAIVLIDAKTGAERNRRTDLENLASVSACAFTPDSSLLITGGTTGRIIVWRVAGDGLLAQHSEFAGHTGEVSSISVSPDSKYVLSGDRRRRVCYWDVQTGKQVFQVETDSYVCDTAITADGKTAKVYDGRSLKTVDLATHRVTGNVQLNGRSRVASFSHDGSLLAMSELYALKVFDTATGRQISEMKGYESIWSIEFSRDSSRVYSGGSGKVHVWDPKSTQYYGAISDVPTSYVKCLAVSSDNQHLAFCASSAGQRLAVVQMPEQHKLAPSVKAVVPVAAPAPVAAAPNANKADNVGLVHTFPDMGWGIEAIAFSPNGKFLAAGKYPLIMFDLSRGTEIARKEDRDRLGEIKAMTFSPDGGRLLTGSQQGRVFVWNVSANGVLTESAQFVGHTKQILRIDVHPNGKTAISTSGNEVRYWDISTGRQIHMDNSCERDVKACRILADGTTALFSDGSRIGRMSLETGEVTTINLGRTGVAHSADISKDGTTLVVSEGSTVSFWSTVGAKSGQLRAEGLQWVVRFTPDGKRLISGGSAVANLWDVKSHLRIHVVDVHSIGYVQSLGISSDGKYLSSIVSMAGQALKVFRLPD